IRARQCAKSGGAEQSREDAARGHKLSVRERKQKRKQKGQEGQKKPKGSGEWGVERGPGKFFPIPFPTPHSPLPTPFWPFLLLLCSLQQAPHQDISQFVSVPWPHPAACWRG